MRKTKINWDFIPPEDQHYFISSVAQWRTGTDLPGMIEEMKRDGYMFNVWLIPLKPDAPYQIEYYAPKVEGRVYLGAFEPNVSNKRN
jgi:hypothetical protein